MSARKMNNGNEIKLKIVYFGTGGLGIPSLEAMYARGIKPVCIVTVPDRPAGRGLKLKVSPVKQFALEHNIPVFQPVNVNEKQAIEQIREFQADMGVLIAYGQKISKELIDVFPRGIINLHASLLPKYRGAAPVNWAIINGERKTGLTVMQINESIDAGKILAQTETEIGELETANELHDRLANIGADLLIDTLFKIQDDSIVPVEQDISQVTRAPKLTKKLGQIDWNASAEQIANLIRGLWPWPGVHSIYRPQSGKIISVIFARAQVPETNESDKEAENKDISNRSVGSCDIPGTITDDMCVATGKGKLRIIELKPAGSKLMSWQDFVNGRHVRPGDRFTESTPL